MVGSNSNSNGSSSSSSTSKTVAPFLRKCYEMVDDESTKEIITWTRNNDSFVIMDITEFTLHLLPKYFKHNNISSFIRQLNIYGFRKIDTDSWEYANDGFIRGQKNLLKNIARRKNTQSAEQKLSVQQQDSSVEILQNDEKGDYTELWKDVQNLKIDKEEVVQELGKIRQHQETVDGKMLRLRDHLGGMEKNQQQMLSFLVMAMQNPGILAQFLNPKEKRKTWRVTQTGSMLEQDTENNTEANNSRMIVKYQPSNEPTPVACSEKTPESVHFSDGMNDFVMDIDFMKLLMDQNLGSFIPPDLPLPDLPLPDLPLPDDSAWEDFILGSPVKEDGQESSDSRTQLEKSQSFKLLLDQIENPQDFDMQPARTSQGLCSDYPTE